MLPEGQMIRVAVLYPRTERKSFDMEYYRTRHMPLVKKHLAPIAIEIDAGIPNPQGQPSPNVAVGYMTFASMDEFLERFAPVAAKLQSDIVNYTDIEPIFQLSEVIPV
jgi:uncharacterized protein (TIGR02118 family)